MSMMMNITLQLAAEGEASEHFMGIGVFDGDELMSELQQERLAQCVMIVVVLVALRNRKTLFGITAYLFERKQRLSDGAFMASLLQLEPPAIGETWWLQDVMAFDYKRHMQATSSTALPITINGFTYNFPVATAASRDPLDLDLTQFFNL